MRPKTKELVKAYFMLLSDKGRKYEQSADGRVLNQNEDFAQKVDQSHSYCAIMGVEMANKRGGVILMGQNGECGIYDP